MSVFNPTDQAMLKQSGTITPDMKVRDYFGMLGIDVDGPVTQLVEAFKGQMKKANPIEKMRSISGGPGMGQPPMPEGGGVPPAPAGDLKSLLGTV